MNAEVGSQSTLGSQDHSFFISDLHLCEQRPELSQAFFTFLQDQACHAKALYILGDFFEYWTDDRDLSPLAKQVQLALLSLSEGGTAVYFMGGNRDFLLGETFGDSCGADLLQEPCLINCHGHKLLLIHGDSLCTKDKGYMALRTVLRSSVFRRLFAIISRPMRQSIARFLRGNSENARTMKAADITDVTPQAVVDLMQEYQVDTLIHGHTHRPAIHSVKLNHGKQVGERIVLGDWDKLGWVLKITVAGRELEQFEILA